MFESRPRLLKSRTCIALIVVTVLAGALALPAGGVIKRPKSRVFKAIKRHPLLQGTIRGTIVVRDSTTARTTKARSLTIDRPVTVPGDVMVAVVTARPSGGETITSPSGWFLRPTRQQRWRSRPEPSAPVQGCRGIRAGHVHLDVLLVGGSDRRDRGLRRRKHLHAGLCTSRGLYSANTRLIAAPSITTSIDGALVVALYGNSSKSSMTAPSGMFEE